GDPDDGVPRVEDLGVGHLQHLEALLAHPAVRFHRPLSRIAGSPDGCAGCMPRWMLASEWTTSPVSNTCLSRRRSPFTCCDGSSPNSLATSAPIFLPGGSYWSLTWISVPRPPGAGRNRTVPRLGTSA